MKRTSKAPALSAKDAIQRTNYFLSGGTFSASEVAARVRCATSTAHHALASLADDGKLDVIDQGPDLPPLYRRRAPSRHLICNAWKRGLFDDTAENLA